MDWIERKWRMQAECNAMLQSVVIREEEQDVNDHPLLACTTIQEQQSILEQIQQANEEGNHKKEYAGPFDSTTSKRITLPMTLTKQQYLCTPILEEDEEDSTEDESSTDSRSCCIGESGAAADDDDTIVREQRRLFEYYAQQKQSRCRRMSTEASRFFDTHNVSDEDVLREQERLLEQIARANTRKDDRHKPSKVVTNKSATVKAHKKKPASGDSCPLITSRRVRIQGYEKAAEAVSLGRAVLRCCPYCRIVLQVDESCRHLYCTNCEQVSQTIPGTDRCQALHNQERIVTTKCLRD